MRGCVERAARRVQESDESDPDSVGTVHTEPPDLDAVDITTSSGGGDVGGEEETEAMSGEKKPALRKYIETFDQDTMRDTARMMSKEGMSLLDRQSTALWGEAKKLQEEMQKVRALPLHASVCSAVRSSSACGRVGPFSGLLRVAHVASGHGACRR